MGISATPSFLDWFLHCASILNFFRRCALHFFFLLFAQIYSVHIFWVLHRYFVEYLEDKNILFIQFNNIWTPLFLINLNTFWIWNAFIFTLFLKKFWHNHSAYLAAKHTKYGGNKNLVLFKTIVFFLHCLGARIGWLLAHNQFLFN